MGKNKKLKVSFTNARVKCNQIQKLTCTSFSGKLLVSSLFRCICCCCYFSFVHLLLSSPKIQNVSKCHKYIVVQSLQYAYEQYSFTFFFQLVLPLSIRLSFRLCGKSIQIRNFSYFYLLIGIMIVISAL